MLRPLLMLALLAFGCSRPVNEPPRVNFDASVPVADVSETQTDAVLSTSDVSMPDVSMPDAAEDANTASDMADSRRSIGQVWNTYYYLAPETDHPGAKTVDLLNDACDPIATVSEDYQSAVCIEGSGLLEDGRVINFSSRCDCGTPCGGGTIICWKALDPATHPWGEGAFGNALVPLRSLAVDRDVIALRTVIYLEQFDGVAIPAVGGVTAFTHDGCFRADDVGGGIDADHIDIFAGSTPMWRYLEGVFPTRSNFDAFVDVAKCGYLEL